MNFFLHKILNLCHRGKYIYLITSWIKLIALLNLSQRCHKLHVQISVADHKLGGEVWLGFPDLWSGKKKTPDGTDIEV